MLSRRERSLIELGVVVLILLGAYLYLVEPLLERRRIAAELIPVRAATLDRQRLVVAKEPALRAELARLEERLVIETPRLLQGETPALAASELEALLKVLAGQAGVEVRSSRILPPVERGGLQEIPMELTVAGGLKEVVRLLYELDRSEKLLIVQALNVRVAGAGQPRDLLTALTVSGYLVPGAPAPGGRALPPGALRD
jgi:Tfp pilus assembly protein PilO